MTEPLPQVRHVYQNHHLDSKRWDRFTPRDDDVIIATSYKSGTTWTQNILLHLIFGEQAEKPNLFDTSPWLDERMVPLDDVIERLEAQRHRRFIKTHLPLDGLPFFTQAKYIVVGRDARDVFMSLWNHYRNYTPQVYKLLNEDLPDRVGPELPQCPSDIGTFWYRWITQGWFEWEREGYPFWSNLHHTQTWWSYRHLPNVLFIHYNDMLNDIQSEIRRIANFLNMDVSDEAVSYVAEATSFDNMKANAENFLSGGGTSFKGGAQTFIHKGTNGRWKGVLSPEDLSLYTDAVTRTLSPICANWLENGGPADS